MTGIRFNSCCCRVMRLSLAFTCLCGLPGGVTAGVTHAPRSVELGHNPVVNVRLTREWSAARKLACLLLDLGHNLPTAPAACLAEWA